MSNAPLSDRVVLFLDRTHQSALMIKMLRGISAPFERHSVYFKDDEDDPVWIPVVAGKGWVIVSGDKGIESNGVNRQSVIDSQAKVFVLADTHSKGAEWAASLVLAHKRIVRTAMQNNGPFYCTVEKGSDSHVGDRDLRFHAGGGPIVASALSVPVPKTQANGAASDPKAPPAKEQLDQRQEKFKFPA